MDSQCVNFVKNKKTNKKSENQNKSSSKNKSNRLESMKQNAVAMPKIPYSKKDKLSYHSIQRRKAIVKTYKTAVK